MLAGRKEGTGRGHVASTRPGTGSCSDLTSHSAPTTKTLHTGSITINHQLLAVCFHRRNSLHRPVDLITARLPQQCVDLYRHIPNHRHCGDVHARAPRAQSHLTPIVATKPRLPRNCGRWPLSSREHSMHPPSFTHTESIALSQLHHTLSQTCLHFRALHSLSLEALVTTSLAALVRVRHLHLYFT